MNMRDMELLFPLCKLSTFRAVKLAVPVPHTKVNRHNYPIWNHQYIWQYNFCKYDVGAKISAAKKRSCACFHKTAECLVREFVSGPRWAYTFRHREYIVQLILFHSVRHSDIKFGGSRLSRCIEAISPVFQNHFLKRMAKLQRNFKRVL